MTKLNKMQSALVRQAGMRAGLEYCILGARNRKAKLPPCRLCSLTNYGMDCANNPIGYRELVIGRARADKIQEVVIGQGRLAVSA